PDAPPRTGLPGDMPGEIERGYLYRYDDRLHVLTFPTQLHRGFPLVGASVARLLDRLKSQFQFIVVDTPRWLTPNVLRVLRRSDLILYVVLPTASSLRAARLALPVISRFKGPHSDLRIVLNRASGPDYPAPGEVADALGIPVYATIADSPE